MREIAFLSKFFSGKHFITTRSQVFMGDFLKIFKIFYRTSVNSSFQHNGPSYIPPCPSYYFEISISLKIEKKIFFLKTMWKVFQEQNIACWDILDLFFLLMPSAFFFFFFFFCLCPRPTRSPWNTDCLVKLWVHSSTLFWIYVIFCGV